MLRIKWQAIACQHIGNPGVNAAQPPDRSEQAKRAAACCCDQPGIAPSKLRHIAALDVGHDQHRTLACIVKRAWCNKMERRAVQMDSTAFGLGCGPILAAA